jgi:hypothetical protein
MSAGCTWWRDDVARESVVNILAAQWKINAFCQLERVESVRLERATTVWLNELQTAPDRLWPQGRMFHAAVEVRWEPARGERAMFQVLLVGDEQLTSPGDGWAGDVFEVGPERQALLWGERRPGDEAWREDRIPRSQHYPVEWSVDRPMVAIVTRDYMQGGIVRLTRFLRVQAVARPEVEG